MSHDHRSAPATTLGTGASGRAMRAFVLGTIRTVTRAFGCPVVAEGPVPRGPAVVAFHHTSPIDAFTIAMPSWEAGEHPIAMVKASVFRHWLSGPIVRTAGMVPVARGTTDGRQHAYRLSLQHLANGHLLYVAPEGTITRELHTVGELRTGAARLAAEARVPLYAAVVAGPERWGGAHGRPFRPVRGVPFRVRTTEVDATGDAEVVTSRIGQAFRQLLGDVADEAAA